MASFNPKVLTAKLNELAKELGYWTSAAREMLSSADFTRIQSTEEVERANQQANIMRDQFETDQEECSRVEEAVTKDFDLCSTAVTTAHQTLGEAEAISTEASEVLEHWRSELALAEAWLARAQRRLELAFIALQQAEMELASARSELSYATSALRSCLNDDSRRNCGGEQRAVSRAEARMHAALILVERAQAEVRDAQREVALAEARVACCRQAVGYAEEAAKLSELALQQASDAMNHAERSLEHVRAADKTHKEAEQILREEEHFVEVILAQMKATRQLLLEIITHFQYAFHHQESAQQVALGAQKEIERQERELHILNQPSNLIEKIGSFASSAVPTTIKFITGGAVITVFAINAAIAHFPPPQSLQQPGTSTSSVVRVEATNTVEKALKQIQDDAQEIVGTMFDANEKRDEEEKELEKKLKELRGE